ncbi:hypothetical protein A3Q56_03963, partial [Intoshia linei]
NDKNEQPQLNSQSGNKAQNEYGIYDQTEVIPSKTMEQRK